MIDQTFAYAYTGLAALPVAMQLALAAGAPLGIPISAIACATAPAAQRPARTTLQHRRDVFDAPPALLEELQALRTAGRIEVAVSAGAHEVRLDVRDSGRGIPPDELPHVFEKFRQVDDMRQGRPMGTGLGLPICRELIRLHEGRIWVDSVVGEGSTFSFTVLRADRLDDFERSIRERPSFVGY